MAKPNLSLSHALVWAGLTVFFSLLLLLLDVRTTRQQLANQADGIHEYARDRLMIYEAVLHNYISLVNESYPERQPAQNYIRHIRGFYPDLQRFLLLGRADADRVVSFEAAIQAQGEAGFRIHSPNASGDSSQLRLNADSYYPIISLEPFEASNRALLGLDLAAHPATREAIRASLLDTRAQASRPHRTLDGLLGYTLFLAFHDRDPHAQGPTSPQLAGLTVELAQLFPKARTPPGLRLYAYDWQGRLLLRHGDDNPATGGAFLPHLVNRAEVNLYGDPLTLVVERQLRWRDLNWPVALLLAALSLFGYLFTEHHRQRKQVAELGRQRAHQKLVGERQQLEERVIERTQELMQRNAELRLQMRENRRLTRKVLNIQEEERRNLARELHDEMGQSLTAIRTDAQLLRQLLPDDEAHRQQRLAADSIDQIAQRIYGVTYGLMRALRPSTLDDLGLVEALRECIGNARLDKRGIQVHLELRGPLNELGEQINITCYRLLQEALSNVLKHAGATQIWFRAVASEAEGEEEGWSFLEMEIRDNGRGFDSTAPNLQASGFGLLGMRERVLSLNGDFEIQSAPGDGCRIRVRLSRPPHRGALHVVET